MLLELPPSTFDLAVVDPPWDWETYSERGAAKSPTAQYITMSFDEIEALQVGRLLARGGVIILWCTWPLIERQARVLRSWGCPSVSGGAWAKRTSTGKLRWGPGYYLRSVCEPFLIGRRPGGRAPNGAGLPNLIETLTDASVDGLAREHSRKPEEFYRLCEDLAPTARRADIFARQTRPGWTAFGNELRKFDGREA